MLMKHSFFEYLHIKTKLGIKFMELRYIYKFRWEDLHGAVMRITFSHRPYPLHESAWALKF